MRSDSMKSLSDPQAVAEAGFWIRAYCKRCHKDGRRGCREEKGKPVVRNGWDRVEDAYKDEVEGKLAQV